MRVQKSDETIQVNSDWMRDHLGKFNREKESEYNNKELPDSTAHVK